MEPFNQFTRTIAIALGAGWASGLNLHIGRLFGHKAIEADPGPNGTPTAGNTSDSIEAKLK